MLPLQPIPDRSFSPFMAMMPLLREQWEIHDSPTTALKGSGRWILPRDQELDDSSIRATHIVGLGCLRVSSELPYTTYLAAPTLVFEHLPSFPVRIHCSTLVLYGDESSDISMMDCPDVLGSEVSEIFAFGCPSPISDEEPFGPTVHHLPPIRAQDWRPASEHCVNPSGFKDPGLTLWHHLALEGLTYHDAERFFEATLRISDSELQRDMEEYTAPRIQLSSCRKLLKAPALRRFRALPIRDLEALLRLRSPQELSLLVGGRFLEAYRPIIQSRPNLSPAIRSRVD